MIKEKSVWKTIYQTFFLILASIIVHETVHVLQYLIYEVDILEISFIGWKPPSYVGWVTGEWSSGVYTKSLDLTLELQAYSIQALFFLVGFSILDFWRLKRIKELYQEAERTKKYLSKARQLTNNV